MAQHNLVAVLNDAERENRLPTMTLGKRHNGFFCSREWASEGIKSSWHIRSDHNLVQIPLQAAAPGTEVVVVGLPADAGVGQALGIALGHMGAEELRGHPGGAAAGSRVRA